MYTKESDSTAESALTDAISAAKELDEDQYTAESYAVLKAAIKAAEAVAAKENATVEEKAAAVKALDDAIAELVKGKALVGIAHKLPAIMNADQICVMDHGKLVATGKHQELIQSCPEYQKLWKAAQDSAEWKVHTAKEGK